MFPFPRESVPSRDFSDNHESQKTIQTATVFLSV